MKKILILLSSIIATGAFSQGNFKFVEETHDFGKVPEGDSIAYEFQFTNVGDQPIKISNVQPSCGCTVPKWPAEAIQPGATGRILAKYATRGRVGAFTKYLTISSDALESSKQIKFVGEVFAADTAKKEEVKSTTPSSQTTKKEEVKKVPSNKKAPQQKKVSSNASPKATNNKGTQKKQAPAQAK